MESIPSAEEFTYATMTLGVFGPRRLRSSRGILRSPDGPANARADVALYPRMRLYRIRYGIRPPIVYRGLRSRSRIELLTTERERRPRDLHELHPARAQLRRTSNTTAMK